MVAQPGSEADAALTARRAPRRVQLPRTAALIGAITAGYLLLAVITLRRHYAEYNADGYTRIIHSYEWLQSPRWDAEVWLPLPTWLCAAGLWLHDSLTATPRVINSALAIVTLVNLALLGRTVGGQRAGWLTALLGLLFPWLIWFGLSGMAEPLFYAGLTTGALGLLRWWRAPGQLRWLALAALGLTLASMTRYEGWFYALVFGALVLGRAWRAGCARPSALLLAALPLGFPLLWIATYWHATGDPLGFAHQTATIKAQLDAANSQASAARRLTDYPLATARLAPRLALCCGAAALYALCRRVWWWPLVALLAGQALLFVGVSAWFTNLGPGAERYLLSNVLLLLPVLATVCVSLPTRPWRWLATGAVALAIAPLLTLFAHPPTTYPDAGTRQVAALAGRVQDAAPPRQGVTPVLLPAAPSDSFNASYALRILSGHPDEWLITSDPQLFQAWVTTLQPRLWIVDTTTHATTPAAARVQQVAQYAVGWTAARAIVSVAAQPEPGQPAQAHGSGFAAGEPTSAWLTTPAGATLATAWQATTAADGTVTGAFTLPPSAAPGAWTLTVAGLQSGVTGTATFVLPAPAP